MAEVEVGIPSKDPLRIDLQFVGLNGHGTDALVVVQTDTESIRVARSASGYGFVAYQFDVKGDQVSFVQKGGTPRTIAVEDVMYLYCSTWQNKLDQQPGWIQVSVATTPGGLKQTFDFKEGHAEDVGKAKESSHKVGSATVWTVRFGLKIS